MPPGLAGCVVVLGLRETASPCIPAAGGGRRRGIEEDRRGIHEVALQAIEEAFAEVGEDALDVVFDRRATRGFLAQLPGHSQASQSRLIFRLPRWSRMLSISSAEKRATAGWV